MTWDYRESRFAAAFEMPDRIILVPFCHHTAATYDPEGDEFSLPLDAPFQLIGSSVRSILQQSRYIEPDHYLYGYLMGTNSDKDYFSDWKLKKSTEFHLNGTSGFEKKVRCCYIDSSQGRYMVFPLTYSQGWRHVKLPVMEKPGDCTDTEFGETVMAALKMSNIK